MAFDPCKLCNIIDSIKWGWLQGTACIILTILALLGIVWIISKWENIINLFN